MKLEQILRDRNKMLRLFWLGLISSFVFIAIGVIIIIMEIL